MVGVCNGTGLFDGKCFPMTQDVRNQTLFLVLGSLSYSLVQQINAFPNIDLVLPAAEGSPFSVTMTPQNYILENVVRFRPKDQISNSF